MNSENCENNDKKENKLWKMWKNWDKKKATYNNSEMDEKYASCL